MKKVLIIGAGFLQAFVIRHAKELGYLTYAVDKDAEAAGASDADHFACIDIVDEAACLAYAQANRVDGVLTAATDYGVLTASYIAEKLKLPGVGYQTAQLVKNKYLVRRRLWESRADDGAQAYEVCGGTDLAALSQSIQYPVMVKPCDGSGSRGICRVNSASALDQACRYAMAGSVTRRAVIESFISGTEYGVESFVENQKIHILAIMRKWMTPPPYYAELGHAFPSGLAPELEERIQACAASALRALGIRFGAVNMDILVTAAGAVHVVDIGARMGGNLIGSHIVPYGTGIDYMGNMIKAAAGDPAGFSPLFRKPVATRLLALSPGRVKALPQFALLEEKYQVKIEHHLKIGDEITPYRTNSDGCGYVVACGGSAGEAADRAEAVREKIDRMIERETV